MSDTTMPETPAESSTPSAKSSAISRDFSVLKGALLGAIGGFAASYFVLNAQLSEMNERLALTPPIVVVDFVKMASAYPEGATAEELEPLLTETNNRIVKLKEAGYLVIDYQNILAAPGDIMYPFEDGSADE